MRRREHSAMWIAVERPDKVTTEKYPPRLATQSFTGFLARAASVR